MSSSQPQPQPQSHSHSRPKLMTVATCQLNQWAMDFEGNWKRILQSCVIAKQKGATYRLGPELEICGYGAEDHFYESDTLQHCWESLVTLLQQGASDDLLCDFGMPVLHQGCRYNCRILCFNRRLLLIRPKTSMADGGNYRESRYFTAYPTTTNNNNNTTTNHNNNQTFLLPSLVNDTLQTNQRECPFGIGYVESVMDGIRVGCESCEELWTPQATHIDLALAGVEIIGNGSGSHHELRKLETRITLLQHATSKCGGIYLYANGRGCDGSRQYYDGCSMICVNGTVVAQAPQFDLHDVCVLTATINVDHVTSYRASIPSLGVQMAQSTQSNSKQLLKLSSHDLRLASTQTTLTLTVTPMLDQIRYHTPEEECCLGPACWLWDYLRRSGASGFLLPLSGGADSSSVATIVGTMCRLVVEAVYDKNTNDKNTNDNDNSNDNDDSTQQIIDDVQRICHQTSDWPVPTCPKELANYILHTVYMGTDNSSLATESRALRLAQDIGAHHLTLKMDVMVAAVLSVFSLVTGHMPRFTSQGGTMAQDVALQNIQARLRMVTAYLFAQLLPWVRGRTGFLLVLGSSNVDEGLRGYMTKYDCSSADLNPIGAISKVDLKQMLLHCAQYYPVLQEIAGAPPTAELRPQEITHDGDTTTTTETDAATMEHSQLDEDEMGMTYEELGWFGRLRKLHRCGPVSMYTTLVSASGGDSIWTRLKPTVVAQKVQRFFYYYAINRHKMCTLTPSYHAEGYSPDDNRFDLRQFLYNPKWERQFNVMNELAEQDDVQYNHKHNNNNNNDADDADAVVEDEEEHSKKE
eukprot:CAMPEP_0119008702 /NCGR_PEP_ID=MMETSP1176-20130426/3874_1 /TAXON_ID=265551 /ORGANISM="Synedropsis recta cf, Strain CCMP1620" /LENGTH=806 /DNA_ID=CAMNT_0006961087 /DNA_START=218 /DNA_END=2638 /DNA_ORIENTATION=+